jgi:hypothetical protein
MQIRLFYTSLLTIGLGGIIYVFFRSDSLIMFKWLRILFLSEYIQQIREETMMFHQILPQWLIYSLPDGLWVCSYTCIISCIWFGCNDPQKIIWVLIIPALAIVSEVGQLARIIPGTFDSMDLFFYLFGWFIPFTIINK